MRTTSAPPPGENKKETETVRTVMQSLVKCTSRFKQHEGYFGTDLVILNLDQMTRMKSCSPNYHTSPAGGPFTHDVRFKELQAHMHSGSSGGSFSKP
ncbi:hypothetical protein AVEN_81097-1 [Araneus ventricosus]|uniref:Uncharacterized protein n=1 Tax=Araneus ventricosus TaxID=182803 RepID=A0A4Y2DVL9_ARAVE|nr:hypothetical protein AVEN_81097-1 [Araneus ventricosus]